MGLGIPAYQLGSPQADYDARVANHWKIYWDNQYKAVAVKRASETELDKLKVLAGMGNLGVSDLATGNPDTNYNLSQDVTETAAPAADTATDSPNTSIWPWILGAAVGLVILKKVRHG